MTIYTVTSTATYVFDTEDEAMHHIRSERDAADDVRSLLDTGRLTSNDFTIAVKETSA